LTVGRILLVPVFVVLLVTGDPGPRYAAAVLFAGLALSDCADGYLARACDLVTTFGRIMDPVADKLLVGAALVSLVAIDRMAAWLAVVVIAREVAVSALRWVASRQDVVIASSAIGKAKTGVQMLAIVALMLTPDTGRRGSPRCSSASRRSRSSPAWTTSWATHGPRPTVARSPPEPVRPAVLA
jgi:CDP-diacylglycerol--glycerol-3-phosphate 3-phosphatidyltransferase